MLQGSFVRGALALFSCAYMGAVAYAVVPDSVTGRVESLFVVDVDGDQQADIAWQGQDTGSEHRVTGSPVAVQQWRDGHLLQNWSQSKTDWIVGDFNGDALTDWLLQGKNEKSSSTVVLTNADSHIGHVSQTLPFLELGLQWDSQHHRLIVGDFNGDNRDDLFLQGITDRDRHALTLADAKGEFHSLSQDFDNAHLNVAWSQRDSVIVAGDFDGNGSTDLLLQPRDQENDTVIVHSADGKQFDTVDRRLAQYTLGQDWRATMHQIIVGDFNGDGKDDLFLLGLKAAQESVYLPASTTGFNRIETRYAELPDAAQIKQVLVGDFDADGIDELILLYKDNKIAPRLLLANAARRARLDSRLRTLGLLTPDYALQLLTGINASMAATAVNANNTRPSKSGTVVNPCNNFTVGTSATCLSDPVDAGPPAPPATPAALPSVLQPVSAVGRLDGEAGVSGGSASYNIPVIAPPGRAGVQPSVSLNYSSRGGNGLAGMGWSLSAGMSSISRCPYTIIHEGYTRAIQYDALDKLCLDGQRLVPYTGTYGADGATYRTEIESFVRVTQSDTLNSLYSSFTIEHSDGGKSFYQRAVIPGGVNVPLSWLLTKTVDVHGNTIEYKYSLAAAGEYLLNDILYTGMSTPLGSFTSTVSGSRSIHFNYIDRPDVGESFVAGGRLRETKRLAQIQTFVGSQQVRSYALGYASGSNTESQATKRTLLRWVQACAYDASGVPSCSPETRFNWAEHPVTYVSEKLAAGALDFSSARKIVQIAPNADRNGDGVLDWPVGIDRNGDNLPDYPGAYVNAEQGLVGTHSAQANNCFVNYSTRSMECLQPDFNLDGITDGFSIDPSTRHLSLQYNGTTGPCGASSCDTGIILKNNVNEPDDTIRLISDFNSDGWPDMAIYKNTGVPKQGALFIYYHTKNLAAPYSATRYQKIADINDYADVRFVGDMDGNGVQDLVKVQIKNNSSIPIPGGKIIFEQGLFASPPSSATFLLLSPTSAGSTALNITSSLLSVPADDQNEVRVHDIESVFDYFMDVNGDGLPDWISWLDDGGNLVLRINEGGKFGYWQDLGTGAGIATRATKYTDTTTNQLNTYIYPKYDFGLRVMDFDGDGKNELLLPSQRVVSACHNILAVPNISGQIGWTCDDKLYLNYSPTVNAFDPVLANDWDAGVYQYKQIKFTQNISGQWSVSTDTTPFKASASQSAPADMWGKGLSDFLTTIGCPANETDTQNGNVADCDLDPTGTYLPGASGTQMIAAGLERGAWVYRNRGSATGPDSGDTKYQAIDVMLSVSDGFNRTASWTLKPLTTGGSTGASCDASMAFYKMSPTATAGTTPGEYFHFASSMYAVRQFDQSNGLGTATNTTKYRYRDALYEAWGRGFQGFHDVMEYDAKGVLSCTTHEQVFPKAGMVLTTTQKEPSTNRMISSTSNTLDVLRPFADYKTWLPYIKTSTITKSDLNAFAVGTIVNVTGLDPTYACPKLVESTVSDTSYLTSAKTSTLTDIPVMANLPAWLFCQKQSDTVTKTLDYGSNALGVTNTADTSKVIKTDYTWTTHRQPKTQTVTLDDGRQRITTQTYDYESPVTNSANYGNLVKTSLSGSDIVTRDTQSITAYSPEGYFPASVANALGHTTGIVTDASNGQPLSIIDPNGIISAMTYDSFGRARTQQVHTHTPITTRYAACTASGTVPTIDCSGISNAVYAITVSQPGVNPDVTRYFDMHNRVLRARTTQYGGSASIVDMQFDALGRVTKTSAPWNGTDTQYWTTFSNYDVLDRPASKTMPNGETKAGLKITYTYAGLITNIQVGSDSSYKVSRTKNALGQWMQTIDQGDAGPNGTPLTTSFRYDANGSPVLIERTPSGGSSIRNTARYNNVGHKTSMSDPEKGTWSYSYDVLGELKSQTDAKLQTTTFMYDKLGRASSRSENSTLVAQWTYDNSVRAGGGTTLGLPSTSAKMGEITKVFQYDAATLPNQMTISPGNSPQVFTLKSTYDAEGRVQRETYPNSRIVVRHDYDGTTGYPFQQVDEAHGGRVLSNTPNQANVIDAMGNVWQEQLGNGLTTRRSYDKSDGRVLGICTYSSACTISAGGVTSGSVQGLDYGSGLGASTAYDEYGNLLQQENWVQGVTESFTYDRRQRLTSSSRNATIGGGFPNLTQTVNYQYDALGNLTQKDDFAKKLQYGSNAGTFTRNNTLINYAPHQVGKVYADDAMTQLIAQYNYDENGNLSSSAGQAAYTRQITYNLQMLPTHVGRGGNSSDFYYDDSGERYFEQQIDGTKTTKTWKIGKLFEYIESTIANVTSKEERYYAGNAEYDYFPLNNCGSWKYFLTDRLGSIETITDANGLVLERHGFDAFGKPRQANWMLDSSKDGTSNTMRGLFSNSTTRGFTGHDHIDSIGLIHMNGRMYDPELGRFLGVDPFISNPMNPQSLNPYSYVSNNPLMGTDPTGYCEAPTGSHICSTSNADKLTSDPRVDKKTKTVTGTAKDRHGNEYSFKYKTDDKGMNNAELMSQGKRPHMEAAAERKKERNTSGGDVSSKSVDGLELACNGSCSGLLASNASRFKFDDSGAPSDVNLKADFEQAMKREQDAGLTTFDDIDIGPQDVTIKYRQGEAKYHYDKDHDQNIIYWDPRAGLECGNSTCKGVSDRQSPATALAHEMDHAHDYIFNYSGVPKNGGEINISQWEQSISQRSERTLAKKYGEMYRTRYTVMSGAVGMNKNSNGLYVAKCVTCLH